MPRLTNNDILTMTLENGDYIEVHYRQFIRQNIPAYEIIWGTFIGHDGRGKMLPLSFLSEKDQNDRVVFSESLYTCIESLVCMSAICKSLEQVDKNKPDEYLDMLNKFIAFQGHAGRIRDNTSDLLRVYLSFGKTQELMDRLEDIYQKRNNVLHSKKLPFKIVDSLVLITPVKGADESANGWHSSMNWADINEGDLVILSDYLNETLTSLCSTFNGILNNLVEPIKKLVASKNSKFIFSGTTEQIDFAASGNVDAPISGSSYIYTFDNDRSA